MMRGGAVAHDAAGIGIVEALLHVHLGGDQPGVEHPADDADGDVHVAEARPEHRDDGDHQHEEREGDHRIDDAAENGLRQAAVIADERADERAEEERRESSRRRRSACRSCRRR